MQKILKWKINYNHIQKQQWEKDPLELPQKKTSSASENRGGPKKMINPYKSS